MSKESKNKKKLARSARENSTQGKAVPSTGKRELTAEEKAQIIRDRLAKRPVIVFRYPNGKINRRFVLMLALMAVALVAALYFLSRY